MLGWTVLLIKTNNSMYEILSRIVRNLAGDLEWARNLYPTKSKSHTISTSIHHHASCSNFLIYYGQNKCYLKENESSEVMSKRICDIR